MFTLIRILNNYFTKRLTAEDLGKSIKVLWNPQGVSDFGEKPNWWTGVIDHVGEDGSFWIDFGSSSMVVPVMIHGWRKNPLINKVLIEA